MAKKAPYEEKRVAERPISIEKPNGETFYFPGMGDSLLLPSPPPPPCVINAIPVEMQSYLLNQFQITVNISYTMNARQVVARHSRYFKEHENMAGKLLKHNATILLSMLSNAF